MNTLVLNKTSLSNYWWR